VVSPLLFVTANPAARWCSRYVTCSGRGTQLQTFP
jgi:hypothetical protein